MFKKTMFSADKQIIREGIYIFYWGLEEDFLS